MRHAAALAGLLLAAACGRGSGEGVVSRAWPAMGGMMSAAVWGPGDSARLHRALDAARDSVELIDARLSADRDDSEVAVLNRLRRTAAPIGTHLRAVLAEALAVAEAAGKPWTGVLFDTVRGAARLAPGTALDLHGIARGYALDRAALALQGVADSALLDLDGQFLWIGPPTRRIVGITNPDRRLSTIAAVELWSGSVSMTPSEDPIGARGDAGAAGLRVVAVLASSGMAAGAWSPVLFGAGCDRALSLAPRLDRWRLSVVCIDAGGARWSPDLEGRVLLPTAPGAAGGPGGPSARGR